MENHVLQVLPLHKHPEYLESCCDMINEEWPRSRTARMMSLTASCDELPTSLILIDEKLRLLGHAKLTRLPTIPTSCFLETVVIAKHMRGKRLGTYLMNEIEKYCKNILKLAMLHLSTKGQEGFYSKLGYVICPPVSIYGNPTYSAAVTCIEESHSKISVPQDTSNIPPPPPMPKPSSSTEANIKTSKTYMFKYL